MAVMAAPVLDMAVNAPVVTASVWLLMILVLIFRVATEAELEIMVRAPVPVFVEAMILFELILSVPAPAEFMIP